MMMAGKKRCSCCGRMFVTDRRVGARQKTCSAACRKMRKIESNKRFGRKNPDYWLGRYEVVKVWRQEHPDYQREWRRRRKERRRELGVGEIQAEMFAKALDAVQKNVLVLREIQAEMPFQLIDIAGHFADAPCRSA
jgi:hypothetical protein